MTRGGGPPARRPGAGERLGALVMPVRPFLRRLTHGVTLGVRVIVIDGDRNVLLVRHGYTPGWHLPGGGVDAGESAEDAARRELAEETNVTAQGPLALHGLFFNAAFGRRDHVACFRVEAFTSGPPPRPGFEIAQIRFCPLTALPADLSPGTARRLAELDGKVPISAQW